MEIDADACSVAYGAPATTALPEKELPNVSDWRFVPGPLSMERLVRSSRAGKRALIVLLLLHTAQRIKRCREDEWVTIPARELKRFGIDGAAKARAIAALERCEIIEVRRQGHQSLRLRYAQATRA